MASSKSLSHAVYSSSEFVRQYAESIKDNPWNAWYERPASRSLLPDLKGVHVLDAGCGPGINTAYFVGQGAIVEAIDYSELMVASAKEASGDKANVRVADLNNGLEMFEDSTFEVVFASLVIHYVDDLNLLFAEFRRVLRDGGKLVFSTDHPGCAEYLAESVDRQMKKTYFWSNLKVYLDVYLRPWKMIGDALKKNDFEISEILEPLPTKECKLRFPEQYEYLSNNKHFICVGATAR